MKYFFLLLTSAALITTSLKAQPWSNGQAASGVIGQPDFISNSSARTSTGLSSPSMAIIDPVTGKVYVADGSNSRVLRFASLTAATNGTSAEAVFGQTNFTTDVFGCSTTILQGPNALYLDSGNLWVSDEDNERIVRFSDAANLSSGAAADMVIGQTDFVSSNLSTTPGNFDAPTGIFISNGTLWVADGGNSRVLRFDNINSKPSTGATADGVLGQTSFYTSNVGSSPSASTMNFPTQIYVDAAGRLWVTDVNNNRILRFDNAASKSNGAAADGVIGQSSFTTSGAATTPSTLYVPFGVYGDPTGNIYVADRGNERILIYTNAGTSANGPNANFVLGHNNFTTSGPGGLSSTAFNIPVYLFVNSTNLLIGDDYNNRIVVETPSTVLPVKIISFSGYILNDGQQAALQWQTAEELNIDRYELQYSTDGMNYTTTLTTINPKGQAVNNYDYLHTTLVERSNYYRLKIINTDGSFFYSNIVLLKNNGKLNFSIYPNPTSKQLVVEYDNTSDAIITIYTLTGQRVLTTSTNGQSKTTFNVANLPTGIYMIEYSNNATTLRDKFVKVN